MRTDYGSAIRLGFEYLLENYKECFVIGQGLWSPWYVGNTMTDLDTKFGRQRIIDTPVSESAVTGLAVGAAIAGLKPIVVHPRMDFMLYATDAIVNEAAKWHSMTGGNSSAGLTIRSIINRGGEQGAQHSQALHSWFMHIPGLRVVMPYTPQDARDLLIASVLSPDPVLYIDDRWLYETTQVLPDIEPKFINEFGPQKLVEGNDLTLVAAGHSTRIAVETAEILKEAGISAEVIDLRVLNPLDPTVYIQSAKRTGRLVVLDGGWAPAGLSAEIIASALENIEPENWKAKPMRYTIPFSPAPSGKSLEKAYYLDSKNIAESISLTFKKSN